jgi:ABC-type polar amino acid transport system ATPase subunit
LYCIANYHDIHFCQEIAGNVTLINDGCNIDQGATADWLSKYDNIELAMIDKLNLSKEA